ncbi:hypothetical protein KSF_100440 [Reticulibacter mediterranei]|uniref:AB hydrolase-1 domain-containing protein n=1 Tax=Reticulibacter mediterranei TaxID=2778369 RepID=A0A8J3J3B6_9CHLR|nr:alpha/beta hydrolase [Reticulibacter mediterranei]GHO99996.1 hypothetical protein KSF_100440 [Reticulibacter mediterranei]
MLWLLTSADMGKPSDPAISSNTPNYIWAGDIIGLLDALGEQQAIVVGHDWGAIIAWDLALLRPEPTFLAVES